MGSLFLELALFVSLAIIVYLMAAAVPRIEENSPPVEGEEGIGPSRGGLTFEKLDDFLIKAKDKALRRLKVLVMKTDNFIGKQLKSKKE